MSANSERKRTQEGLSRRNFLRNASLGVIGAVAAGVALKSVIVARASKKPDFGDIPPEGSIFEPRADIKEAWLKKSLSKRQRLLRRN